MRLILSWAAILVFCGALRSNDSLSEQEANLWKESSEWYSAGSVLDELGAAALEDQVKRDPGDRAARSKLLSYYTSNQRGTADKGQVSKKYEEHYLWYLKNEPETHQFVYWVGSDPVLSPGLHKKLSDAWDKEVRKMPAKVKVLSNAASFFTVYAPEKSLELYRRAEKAEPSNASWNWQMGHILMRDRKTPLTSSAKALEQFELAMAKGGDIKDVYQVDAAEAALKSGEKDKASRYCNELLARKQTPKTSWNSGNVQFHANKILGLLAFQDGDMSGAKKYLLLSGQTTGSPQLNSFGPDFALADALLKAGERKAVLKFLKLCQTFWKEGKAEKWIKEIEAGNSPPLDRFGAS